MPRGRKTHQAKSPKQECEPAIPPKNSYNSTATSTPTQGAQRPTKREAIWNSVASIFGSTSGRSTRASTPAPLPKPENCTQDDTPVPLTSPGNFTQNDTTTSAYTTGAPPVPLIYISDEERDLEGNDALVKAPENCSRGTPKLGKLLQQEADDLWVEASNGLPAEYRQDLGDMNDTDGDKSEALEALKRLLKHAMEAKKKNTASQWKLRLGSKEINVREKAEKLVGWIMKFKEVVDVAIQYDPVHAALPWAGVRFILTVCPHRDYPKRLRCQFINWSITNLNSLLVGH